MARRLLTLVLALALLPAFGCAKPPVAGLDAAQEIAARHHLSIEAEGESQAVTLPATLDPNGKGGGLSDEYAFGLIQTKCLADGYDISPYLNQKVTVRGYRLKERYDGSVATLRLVEHGSIVAGAFVSADGYSPGVISLSEMEKSLP